MIQPVKTRFLFTCRMFQKVAFSCATFDTSGKSDMDGGLSPPRSKRRKLSAETEDPPKWFHHGLTVYSWNINGISPFIQQPITSYFKPASGKGRSNIKGGQTTSLRAFLRRHGWPTILCLQEVEINPDDNATIHAVQTAVRRQANESATAPEYRAEFCLPSDKFNARGFGRKVYGVCSIVREDFNDVYVDSIRPVKWDAEGRFLVLETKPKTSIPKLAIVNIYAVNGTDHPYRDPITGKESGTRHDRKLQVHALLQRECRDLEARGFGVVLAGDMNIARAPVDGHPNLRTFPKQHCLNRADFETRFFSDSTVVKHDASDKEVTPPGFESDKDISLGMIDTFRHLHPDRKSYTYYPRTKPFGESCDRVDMIMVSKGLEDNLKDAEIHETPSERGPSDHVPLYVRLDFGNGVDKSDQSRQLRHLSS